MKVFVYCSGIDAPSNEFFAWHCRDDAFEILDPPWWRQLSLLKREKEEEALILVMIVIPINISMLTIR
ncbi:MAG TPA: hypothetical protein VKA87_11070 [Nitrososphaeraceae archaeon]|nr:hypothetical protein [Nitrososphaeraceae archaeon]